MRDPEQIDAEDHDVIESLQLATAVAYNPPPDHEPRTEHDRVGQTLIDCILEIKDALDWAYDDVVDYLSCPHPHPESWRKVDIALLEQSRNVMTFLAEQTIGELDDEPAVRERRFTLCVEAIGRSRGNLSNAWLAVAWSPAWGVLEAPIERVGRHPGAARKEMVRRSNAPLLRRERVADLFVSAGSRPASSSAGAVRIVDRAEHDRLDAEFRALLDRR